MKKIFEEDLEDDLLPEYDFRNMKVVARGPARRKMPLIVEMTGIFGAGYLPGLFRPLTLSLRQNYSRTVEGKVSPLVTMFHVDNTAAEKADPARRARISHLISHSSSLNENEWTELISSLKWADTLFEKHLTLHSAETRNYVDVVFRRGGRLQNYILIGGPRWQEADINRIQPKLQYFLWADLDTIRQSFMNDEDVRRELRRDPESYCATPERAFEQQQDWLEKVNDFASVKTIKRISASKEKFAQDIVSDELVKGLDFYGMKVKRKGGVFISYATADQPFADLLAKKLQERDISCWFAPKDMQGGKRMEDQIDHAIENYDRLLVVLSEHSIRSNWVTREIRKAFKFEKQQNRKKLFPIRLVGMGPIQGWQSFYADLVKDLGEEIREYYIPDFSNWQDIEALDKHIDKLVHDLRST
jgi:hypothetical protein